MPDKPKRPWPLQILSGLFGALGFVMIYPACLVMYHKMGFGDPLDPAGWKEKSLAFPLVAGLVFLALSLLASWPGSRSKSKILEEIDNKKSEPEGSA